MMLPYLVSNAVVSTVELVTSHIGKGVILHNPVSETYPFTEKAIIAYEHVCQSLVL